MTKKTEENSEAEVKRLLPKLQQEKSLKLLQKRLQPKQNPK